MFFTIQFCVLSHCSCTVYITRCWVLEGAEYIFMEPVEEAPGPGGHPGAGRRGRADVHWGGWWAPTACRSRQKLAVIIPYRDRRAHLQVLLRYLHPFLHRQQRHYHIFVVEQVGNVDRNVVNTQNRQNTYSPTYIGRDTCFITYSNNNNLLWLDNVYIELYVFSAI